MLISRQPPDPLSASCPLSFSFQGDVREFKQEVLSNNSWSAGWTRLGYGLQQDTLGEIGSSRRIGSTTSKEPVRGRGTPEVDKPRPSSEGRRKGSLALPWTTLFVGGTSYGTPGEDRDKGQGFVRAFRKPEPGR
jgi:hypothetical protein